MKLPKRMAESAGRPVTEMRVCACSKALFCPPSSRLLTPTLLLLLLPAARAVKVDDGENCRSGKLNVGSVSFPRTGDPFLSLGLVSRRSSETRDPDRITFSKPQVSD